MEEEAVGFGGDRGVDLGAEAEDGFEAGEGVDAHAEIDDDEVGVGGEVDGLAGDWGGHGEWVPPAAYFFLSDFLESDLDSDFDSDLDSDFESDFDSDFESDLVELSFESLLGESFSDAFPAESLSVDESEEPFFA